MQSPIIISVLILPLLGIAFIGIYLKKWGWNVSLKDSRIRLLSILGLFLVASTVHSFIGLREGLLTVLVLGALILYTSQRAGLKET